MADVSGKVTSFLAKAAGVAGLTLIAYDSHSAGQRGASMLEKSYKTDSLTSNYMQDMKLDTQSVVKTEVKKRIFQFNMDEGITPFFANITGYLKGFCSMLVDNVIPLGLAVGAVVAGKKGGRNLISKFSALGLLAYGGIFLVKEIFGIGKSSK